MEGFNVKDKSLLENKEFLQELMERMMLVHTFEERAFWLFGQGLVHGTMHLSIGEEATGVGTSAALTKDDYMLATHRGHGQALGKGVNVNDMMAEILGRATGTNHGKVDQCTFAISTMVSLEPMVSLVVTDLSHVVQDSVLRCRIFRIVYVLHFSEMVLLTKEQFLSL